jgi:hypothetical protein
MNLLSIIKIAYRALARNKMRAALTMLGVIIGVAAVIAMVSIVRVRRLQCRPKSPTSVRTFCSLAQVLRTSVAFERHWGQWHQHIDGR